MTDSFSYKISCYPLLIRIIRRLLLMLLVLWGITLVSFIVIHLAPGTPTDMQTSLNPIAGDIVRDRLNALYGLDKPILTQYFEWISRLVKFDFGLSLSTDPRPVLDKILERMPLTLGMNLVSLVLTLLIAIPVGIVSAVKQGSFLDKFLTVLVFIGYAIPGFWLALLCMMYFSIELGWFPVSGIMSMDYAQMTAMGKICDIARHLALPIFVGLIGSIAGTSRFLRSSMLEVMRQDFIVTARAKGLPNHIVIYRHALKNALLPVITMLGLSIPGLIGGSVIIETVFALPGMGQLFYAAVMSRDYPLIMGNLVLGAVLTLLGNLLADISYSLADPRIRNGNRSEGI